MPIENRKKSFYFEVARNTLVLIQICVFPDAQKSRKTDKYKWFTDRHLLKLLAGLKDISLVKVLSGDIVEASKDISEVVQGPAFSFHIRYTFKKRGITQFVLTQSPWARIHSQESVKKLGYSGGRHIEFHLFSQKLVVFVSLEPIRLGAAQTITMSKSSVTAQMLKARKEKSKYFNKENDSRLTSSAVKKQANLRSIVEKMKKAAVEKDSSIRAIQVQQSENIPANTTVNEPNKIPANSTVNKPNNMPGNSTVNKPNNIPANSAVNKQKNIPANTTVNKQNNIPANSTVNKQNNIEESKERPKEKSCNQDISGFDNSSRKRLRQEVDHSEDTGSESQHSEREDDRDFITKKSLSRKKRQKYLDKDLDKDCEQSKNNQLPAHTDSISTEVHSAKRSKPGNHTNITDKALCVYLSDDKETNCKSGISEEIAVQEELSVHSRQYDVPAIVVVEEMDVNEREHETITINDVTPCFKNVKEVADLTDNHIEFLIQKLQKKLKNIFKGKEYCRRHEDYKKGGRSRGDLAFQVRFGLYSEDQHEAIMTELMSIFCARHNKYIDYLSKVLLPETFVIIYMEVFGGNHDDVERMLMGNKKKQMEIQTDGSSTE